MEIRPVARLRGFVARDGRPGRSATNASTVPRIAQNEMADQQAAAEHAERRREVAFPEEKEHRDREARDRRVARDRDHSSVPGFQEFQKFHGLVQEFQTFQMFHGWFRTRYLTELNPWNPWNHWNPGTIFIGELHDPIDIEDTGGKSEKKPDEREPGLRAERPVQPITRGKADHQRKHERQADRAELPDELQRRRGCPLHGSV